MELQHTPYAVHPYASELAVLCYIVLNQPNKHRQALCAEGQTGEDGTAANPPSKAHHTLALRNCLQRVCLLQQGKTFLPSAQAQVSGVAEHLHVHTPVVACRDGNIT